MSTKAQLGQFVFFVTEVRIYGNVIIEDNTIIEGFVKIGHPTTNETENAFANERLNEIKTLDELYNEISNHPVKIGGHSIIRTGTVIYGGVPVGEEFYC